MKSTEHHKHKFPIYYVTCERVAIHWASGEFVKNKAEAWILMMQFSKDKFKYWFVIHSKPILLRVVIIVLQCNFLKTNLNIGL